MQHSSLELKVGLGSLPRQAGVGEQGVNPAPHSFGKSSRCPTLEPHYNPHAAFLTVIQLCSHCSVANEAVRQRVSRKMLSLEEAFISCFYPLPIHMRSRVKVLIIQAQPISIARLQAPPQHVLSLHKAFKTGKPRAEGLEVKHHTGNNCSLAMHYKPVTASIHMPAGHPTCLRKEQVS